MEVFGVLIVIMILMGCISVLGVILTDTSKRYKKVLARIEKELR
jgi:hypothetical protein